MAQSYLGTTALNQTWLGGTQIIKQEGPAPIAAEGLLGYYIPAHPDGYAGNTIYDLSGNDNNLILSGSYSLVGDTMTMVSSSNAVSQTSYAGLTGADPQFTFIIIMNLTGSISFSNHWFLGTGNTSLNWIGDNQAGFATFTPQKLIVGNGSDSWTGYGGINPANNIQYARGTTKTMWAIRRDISSTFSSGSNTLNGSWWVRNYNYNGLNVNGVWDTNKVYLSGQALSEYIIETTSPYQPFNVDWSSASPKLYIGSNPTDSTFTGQINFAGAFIYNRLLSDSELQGIYDYVKQYVTLP